MTSIVRRAGLRHFLRHPWQALLAVLGVSLGVAVVVSIDLANASALRAFEISSDAIAGKATHVITGGPEGLDEAVFVDLRREHQVRPSAPTVTGYVTTEAAPGRLLQLVGLDPFSEAGFRSYLDQTSRGLELDRLMTEPGALWASQATAGSLGLSVGDPLSVQVEGVEHPATLAGLLQPHDLRREALTDVLVCDLATAQEILGLEGRLTRIDLILPPGPVGERRAAEIRALLPAGAYLDPVDASGAAANRMTAAFRTNLQALSLLALLCGGFLIYNTVTFAVVQRRRLFGGLRALGVTRREVLALVLGEASIIGLLGCVLGLLGGVLLGRTLLDQVTRTINDLYFSVAVRDLALDAWSLAKGATLGIGASLAAALAPAFEAMSTSPRAALDRAELEARAHRAVPRATAAGLGLLAAGLVLLRIQGTDLVASFAGLFAVLVGCALLTPLATIALAALLTPVAGLLFGQLGRLAARGVVAALSRTSVAIAALMIAVSVIVGVDVMVRSFRDTVTDWLEYSLPADLYISAQSAPTSGLPGTRRGFEPELLTRFAAVEGVDGMSVLKQAEVRSADRGPVRLIAVDLDPRSHASFAFKEGDSDLWPAWRSGMSVIVSEPFSTRTGLGMGSTIELLTPTGPRTWPIAGVYYDYASELGAVTLARETYRQVWGDDRATAISIRVAAAQSPEQVQERLRAAGGDRELLIRSNQAIRAESLRVFDRTFVVTGTLRMLATLVAFVGVLSALMALQLEKARELGMLRAQGLTPGQLWTLVTSQTGLMGLIAGLLAVPVGIATAAVMIYVINHRSFGWTLEMQLDAVPLLAALGVAVGAALLAGVYPAYRMATTSPAEALRSE